MNEPAADDDYDIINPELTPLAPEADDDDDYDIINHIG